MLKQILVAIDHSPISQQVFEQALTIVQTNEANLILLHVLSVAESDQTPQQSSYPAAAFQHVYLTQRKFGSQYSNSSNINLLRGYAQKAIALGIKTEYSQITGCPGSTICEFAHSCSADLIVLGRRGITDLPLLSPGSTSKYVMQHAPCPIFLVETPLMGETDLQAEGRQKIYA